MKVGELMELLGECDGDADVILNIDFNGDLLQRSKVNVSCDCLGVEFGFGLTGDGDVFVDRGCVVLGNMVEYEFL